jgi:hypothetical protein
MPTYCALCGRQVTPNERQSASFKGAGMPDDDSIYRVITQRLHGKHGRSEWLCKNKRAEASASCYLLIKSVHQDLETRRQVRGAPTTTYATHTRNAATADGRLGNTEGLQIGDLPTGGAPRATPRYTAAHAGARIELTAPFRSQNTWAWRSSTWTWRAA